MKQPQYVRCESLFIIFCDLLCFSYTGDTTQQKLLSFVKIKTYETSYICIPTGSVVAVQREDGGPWRYGMVTNNGDDVHSS